MTSADLRVRRLMANTVPDGDCWIWTARRNQDYGVYGGRVAHRVAYELMVGEIPEGLELDHLCNNPPCVNPHHLEPVTRAENMRRRSEAQTHCKHGHEFTPENTYLVLAHNPGRRACRACNRAAVSRYKARLKVAA